MLISAEHVGNRLLVKLSYNIEEAAAASGININAIREAVSTGRLKARKIGRRWIIKASDLEKFVAS